MSLQRLLQELYGLCAHLAGFQVCRSASLPRVPLCCHVWKQASALMYNTSLDPCFWFGCWQDSAKEKLVPKRRSLQGWLLSLSNKKTCLKFYLWSVVRICLFVLFLGVETTKDKNVSHSFNEIFFCVTGKNRCCLKQQTGWPGKGNNGLFISVIPNDPYKLRNLLISSTNNCELELHI